MSMKLTMSCFAWVLILASASFAQEWTHYGRDAGGSKFSNLEQINRENVSELEVAWQYRHGDLERKPERRGFAGFQVTPILLPEAAGRSLVLCTPLNRIVALDPVIGEERWIYDPKIELGPFGTRLKCLGVSYWKDGLAAEDSTCAHRIVMGTTDRRLIAVDATNGRPCPDFGVNGQVDINPIIAQSVPITNNPWGIVFTAPPAIVGDVIVMGSINNMKNRYVSAANGAIRAFDARTGAPLWTFDPIPHKPSDPQYENWDPDSLAVTGGGNSWTILSADQERDLVFVPTSSAAPNFYGGTRPGDNRYANSVVALRGSTGEVVWHFQTIHHDVWDWDVPSQPMLVDITRDGTTTPVVVQLTKPSLIFVFDRETGEPFFPIEERPVPTDGVPGEILSPTQPFPVKPPPLMKTGITPDDAWGITMWDKAQCRVQIESARHGDIYTPPSTDGWVMFPGTAGGLNWGGGAFDPKRDLLVTKVQHVGLYLKLLPKSEVGSNPAFDPSVGAPMGAPSVIEGTDYAIEQRIFLSPYFIPCTPPPWSTLVAVDLAEGKIKWTVPFGTIDRLAPLSIPFKFGTPTAGGPMATAGGLVFIGATADHRFRAFDIETGDQLWETEMPTSAHASPMTYEVDGRQFVVIAAGGHMFINGADIDDYLMAYALPVE
jgi:quinoprotein glucose dehydrogenase